MDIGTIIIGAMTIGLFILPFAVTGRGKKKREKRLLEALTQEAAKQGSSLTQVEYCGYQALALDATSKKLYHAKLEENHQTSGQMDLSTVKRCRMVKTARTIQGSDGNTQVVDWVALVFSHKDPSKGETHWVLFDSEEHFQLVGELQLAEKWAERVNEHLKQIK